MRVGTRTLKGETLYLSLPLCRLLKVEELASVVGHELGHFKGADTRFSTQFAPIYRGTQTALAAVEQETQGFWRLGTLPVSSVLNYFLASFAVTESAIGRQRELAADAVGAGCISDFDLAALGLKLTDLTVAAAEVVPGEPAIGLIDNYEAIEKDLSSRLQSVLADLVAQVEAAEAKAGGKKEKSEGSRTGRILRRPDERSQGE